MIHLLDMKNKKRNNYPLNIFIFLQNFFSTEIESSAHFRLAYFVVCNSVMYQFQRLTFLQRFTKNSKSLF